MKKTTTANSFYLTLALLYPAVALAGVPSFDCKAKGLGLVEQSICSDSELTALDQQLSAVFEKARAIDAKTVNGILVPEQRGWIKGRNECWKESDLKKCTLNSYIRRISELQARYRLLSPVSTATYICDKNPAHELVVNYFATQQKVALVEHGDSTFTLFADPAGANNRYLGGNEILSVTDESVEFIPAYQAPALNCIRSGGSKPRIHQSWDTDKDGLNDCEKDGSCDHTVDYTKPRA